MEIRPIRTEEDLKSALREIDRLWGASQGTPEGDKLDVLATLVEAYENEHHPVAPADPVEMLHFAIEDMGRSQAELAQLLGSRARASEILNRKRHLTLAQIRLISEAWRLPIEVLAAPYRLDRDAA
jgi:HTH-type transcriptional regulator / antitoxin HigA